MKILEGKRGVKMLSKYNINFLVKDDYDKQVDCISTSQIIKAPREAALSICFKSDTRDPISMWKLAIGSAVHKYREDQENTKILWAEKRFFMDIDGMKLTGKPDLVDFDYNQPAVPTDDGQIIIEDLKVSSVWTYKAGEFENYKLQLSIGRLLVNDFFEANRTQSRLSDVGVITFIAIDWDNGKKKYMDEPIKEIPLKLIPLDETYDIVKKRMVEIYRYVDMIQKGKASKVPMCLDEYREKYSKKKCTHYCSVCKTCQKLRG